MNINIWLVVRIFSAIIFMYFVELPFSINVFSWRHFDTVSKSMFIFLIAFSLLYSQGHGKTQVKIFLGLEANHCFRFLIFGKSESQHYLNGNLLVFCYMEIFQYF